MMWYIIIPLLFIMLYASLYFIFENELTIYQTSLNHFDFAMLYKKQPIIIEDNVQDINQLIDSWFNINIVHYGVLIDNLWMRNKYKYLLISSHVPIEVTICNPLSKVIDGEPALDSLMTTIKLKNNKVLILPFKWYYHVDLQEGYPLLYGVHDYITYGISMLSNKS